MKYTALIRLTLFVLFVPFVFSCQTSYKVSKDSYVFERKTYRPVENQQAEEAETDNAAELAARRQAEENEIIVNAEAAIVSKPSVESVDEKVERTKDAPRFVQNIASGTKSREEAVADYNNLSKKEKKEVNRWVKREAKAYKKEAKELKKAKGTDAVTRDMRTGIILGAVGLVLLLIAGGGVLGAIGAILFVVGLVFILLEVL